MRRLLLASVRLGLALGALGVPGCDRRPSTACEAVGGAQVCMEIGDAQVHVRGMGFERGSTVQIAFPEESGMGPLDQSADDEGRVPPEGGAVITGLTDAPRRMTWDGTSVSGEPVHVELVLPAR